MAEPGNTEAAKAFQALLAHATNHRQDCSYIKHYLNDEHATNNYEKAVADYIEQWPDYCEECSGWGGRMGYYDPSPAGVSLSAGGFADFDPCPSCMEEGKCPRCGQESDMLDPDDPEWGGEDFICPECSWAERRSEGIPLDGPYPTECDCWDEDLNLSNDGLM
jgi:hypothetical protein